MNPLSINASGFKLLHFWVGTLGLVAFVVTGLYMLLELQGLMQQEAGSRMMYRSAHLYLMLTSVLNLALANGAGINYLPKWLTLITSLIVVSAPFFMLMEFFFGARSPDEIRQWAYYPLIAIFAVYASTSLLKLWRMLTQQK